MDRVNKPRGLIRYSSYNGIEKGEKLKLTPRIAGYTVLLTILLFTTGYLIASRSPLETTILRTPGTLYQETEGGEYQNLFNLKIINKTSEPKNIELKLTNVPGTIQMIGKSNLTISGDGITEAAFFVRIPKAYINSIKTPIEFEIYADGDLIETVRTNFFGPGNVEKKR